MSSPRTMRPVLRVRFGTDVTAWSVACLLDDRFTVRGTPVRPGAATVASFEVDPAVSLSVNVRAMDPWATTDQAFVVSGRDSRALMPVLHRLTRSRLDASSPERPIMSVPSVPVSGAQSATVLVRLAGHTERLRADSLDADGFVLRTRVLVPGVWTTATLEPTEAVRVRVGVIAGAVDASGRQRFTVAEAADEPLLRLVGTLISARVTDIADVPPATILPPSVTVLPFVPPAPR